MLCTYFYKNLLRGSQSFLPIYFSSLRETFCRVLENSYYCSENFCSAVLNTYSAVLNAYSTMWNICSAVLNKDFKQYAINFKTERKIFLPHTNTFL